jgi:hypothetical protein
MSPETLLEMAVRHVREGEQRVTHQRDLVDYLQTHGHPTGLAKELVASYEDVLRMQYKHLDLIAAEDP